MCWLLWWCRPRRAAQVPVKGTIARCRRAEYPLRRPWSHISIILPRSGFGQLGPGRRIARSPDRREQTTRHGVVGDGRSAMGAPRSRARVTRRDVARGARHRLAAVGARHVRHRHQGRAGRRWRCVARMWPLEGPPRCRHGSAQVRSGVRSTEAGDHPGGQVRPPLRRLRRCGRSARRRAARRTGRARGRARGRWR
jgi:hypothetical protein